MLCWKPVRDPQSSEDPTLEALRCEFATLGGAWPASLLSSADKILATLDGVMALVSVLGASSDSASLTVLSSSGPDAFVVVPGRVLPTPWQAVAPSNKESCAEPKGSPMGPTNPHTTLIWQSGSQQTLPYEWHQLLGQTRFAESLALSAALEPVVLYSKRCELVGALLVVSYAGELPCNRIPISPSTTAPFESPGTWHGGEVPGPEPQEGAGAGSWLRRFRQRRQRGRGGGKSDACVRTAPAGPSPRLLQSLAGVLGQSALAPHWPAVSRICDATQSIAAASSLPEFASLLSSTVADALAADLHVTFSVRVAVVPPLLGSHGFFLPSEASVSQLPSTPSASLLLWAAEGTTGLVKRAASHGILPGIATGTSSRILQAARSVSGRDCSFSGRSPASASHVFLPLSCQPVAGRAATPFALSSALLLQVLRPAMRTGHASTHASTHAGSMNTYQTDEPTVRHMVATKATASPLFIRQHSSDTSAFPTVEAPSPVARDARDVLMSSYGTGVSCSSNNILRAGCGGGGAGGGPAASAVTGMVIANVAALMQDVERPASDVAALLMSQKSKRVTSSGRVSNGGGGSAAVPPPSCLVVVAGAIMPRSGSLAAAVTAAAAAAAAINGSVHCARRSKPSAVHTGITEDWVKTLEASLRGGMVDMSMRGAYAGGSVAGGGAYAGGSVAGGGVYAGGSVAGGGAYAGGSVKAGSCGPAVAVYLSSSDRLPVTLLRAAKDRAATLLELLLPVCAAAIIMGPIRADLDALAPNLFAAAYGSGGGNGAANHGSRRGAAAMLTAANASVATAAGSGAASPTLALSGGHSLFSTATHVSVSQLTLPAATSPIGPTSPLNTDASLRFTIRHPSVSTAAAPGAATCLRSAPIPGTTNNGLQSPTTPLSALPSSVGKIPDASDHDVFLLAHAKWPDGSPTFNPNALPPAAWPPPSCPSPPALTSACTATEPLTSSVVRISPSLSSAASGAGQAALASLLASAEVHWGTWGSVEGGGGHAGMCDEMVTNMRDNLDVWVDSFWAMLREPAAGGARGAMAGSYADDDLRYLRLQRELGSGGAASVYAGMLLGMEVAVKVINPPPEVDLDELVAATAGDTTAAVAALGGAVVHATGGGGENAVVEGSGGEDGGEGAEAERRAGLASALRAAQMRELVRSARECAVMTSLSHPAIVQVYSYHTRVRVNPAEGPEGLPRLMPVPPGEANEGPEGQFHSVLVMERCDLGSLADALDNGLFKRAIIAAAAAVQSALPSNTAPQQPTSQPHPAASPAGSSAPSPQPSRRSLQNNTVQATDGFSFASPPGSTPAGGAGSGGSGGAAMRAIHLTLLELALALRHLHALNLVHCDVKVANLLLKCSASDPRGFTSKLSDFGLVNLLRPEEEGEVEGGGEEGEGRKDQAGEVGDAHTQRESKQGKAGVGGSGGGEGGARGASKAGGARLFMRNMDAAGTVTHLAPECFTPSSRLDASVDVYAFGIVMWEVFTRKPPYAEYAPDFEGLPTAVMSGLRPRFPSHCPVPYKALAHACWCADPARRPTASNIVHCLQHMLEGGVPQPHALVCGRG